MPRDRVEEAQAFAPRVVEAFEDNERMSDVSSPVNAGRLNLEGMPKLAKRLLGPSEIYESVTAAA